MIRITIHSTDDPDVPERLRFIAHLFDPHGLLPVRFAAGTADEARAAAEVFLAAEREKRDRAKAGRGGAACAN